MADFSASLTGRFVDDDDIVRTGRAMIEIDGFDMLHLPVPTGTVDAIQVLDQDLKSYSVSAKESASVASAAQKAAKASETSARGSASSAASSASAASRDATASSDGASRAEVSASAAKQSETNAEDAARRASNSATSANRSSVWVSNAGQRAEKSASAAAGSAESAKADADRAANVANSTSWNGDKLTVNGKTSPSLTGPKGDRGTSGASTWDAVTGKPTTFPPSTHTHKMADISDLPEVGFSEGKIAKYASGGTLIVKDNGSQNVATSRKYVDRAVREKADKSYVDTVLSGKAAQVDVLALQQKLARLTAPVTVFQGSHALSNGNIGIVTPRMYGTVTITISQAIPGTNGGLVQPCIFNCLGTRYTGGMDGWWTTTGGAGTAYKYLTDVENGQKITLDPGYYIEGIEIHPWDTGATTITKITVQN